MTVAELISKLNEMPPDLPVKVYEFDGDFWDDLAVVRPNEPSQNEILLIGQYGVDIS